MKLKTLKDLQFRNWNSCTDEQLDNYIRGVLKAEAIKWVKEDRKDLHLMTVSDLLSRWIRRFNIRGEDLK